MYERFFGLVDAPFRLTPDPSYLYLSRKHAEALAHLRLGLTESSGFVCITGDVGTGKTTLLRAFLADLGPEVATAYIFNPAVTAVELVQRINRELGLAVSGGSQMELVDALNDHLLAQRRTGGLSVVVIDEAQAFSLELLEQLRLLSNLETTTEKLLRVVLVGQPQLRALLLDPALAQLNQRITLRWHMGPLASHETAAYVRHRLRVASRGKVPHVFTGPALWLLHRLSGGVPRLINMIAHRAMLTAFVARRRRVSVFSVLRAYREIGVVPLPRAAAGRRVAWAASALAAGVGLVTLGAPRLAGWWPDLVLPGAEIHRAPEPAEAMVTAPPAEAAPAAVEPAATEPSAPASVAKALVPAAFTSPPPAAAGVELEQRLASLDSQACARAAVEALLAAWHTSPPADDETHLPGDLDRLAWRRGLEHLPLNANRSMLGLLDLPAILALRIGADGPRYVALTGMEAGKAVLVIDGTATAVDAGFLDRFWFGEAHALWRDFEGLGPTFGREARGVAVARLQALLGRTGSYAGEQTGAFDATTETAVLDFQRSRRLVVDGRVGRLTRIVLYAAAGGYPRPTLVTPLGGAS
jgi:general secretion pathway protein A